MKNIAWRKDCHNRLEWRRKDNSCQSVVKIFTWKCTIGMIVMKQEVSLRFARELIRMIDEGQTLSIDEVCNHVETGNIVQYIKSSCGFKNVDITVDNVKEVNSILAERYVSEREAQNQGITNNGLLYLLNLIIDFNDRILYDIKWNSE